MKESMVKKMNNACTECAKSDVCSYTTEFNILKDKIINILFDTQDCFEVDVKCKFFMKFPITTRASEEIPAYLKNKVSDVYVPRTFCVDATESDRPLNISIKGYELPEEMEINE